MRRDLADAQVQLDAERHSANKADAEALRLRRDLADAHAEIERWKLASGLECGGDPDGVTPEKAEEYWRSVERETPYTVAAILAALRYHCEHENKAECPNWGDGEDRHPSCYCEPEAVVAERLGIKLEEL